ncbi:LysE family translocator [Curvivirga aplysinae]|uniref:LysE family translocator n=1 Tax=Curvivirga aplysinae TaxID=2529852 RepID=UPI001C3F5B42|nr:LysE family translocator [Curvivirga aplysinae]
MVDWTLITLFIPTFFLVSITPGMCMTLAMTLGMTIGLRRTFAMMWGEVIGVAAIALAAIVGVAAVMLKYPDIFSVVKYVGGAYLAWLGIQMWRSKGKMAIDLDNPKEASMSGLELAWQGFMTAIANPKGWAFMVVLLPKFLNTELPVTWQIIAIITVIVVCEFFCMTLYAGGGKTLRYFLEKKGNVQMMNRIAGSLMVAVGIWLAMS